MRHNREVAKHDSVGLPRNDGFAFLGPYFPCLATSLATSRGLLTTAVGLELIGCLTPCSQRSAYRLSQSAQRCFLGDSEPQSRGFLLRICRRFSFWKQSLPCAP